MTANFSFYLEHGSAGTFRIASDGWKRVNYDSDGKVIFSNLPKDWRVPEWPGDENVSCSSYSLGHVR